MYGTACLPKWRVIALTLPRLVLVPDRRTNDTGRLGFGAVLRFVDGTSQGIVIAGYPSQTTDLNRLSTGLDRALGVLSLAVLIRWPTVGAII